MEVADRRNAPRMGRPDGERTPSTPSSRAAPGPYPACRALADQPVIERAALTVGIGIVARAAAFAARSRYAHAAALGTTGRGGGECREPPRRGSGRRAIGAGNERANHEAAAGAMDEHQESNLHDDPR